MANCRRQLIQSEKPTNDEVSIWQFIILSHDTDSSIALICTDCEVYEIPVIKCKVQ
jgi:hypothetical protein